MALLILFRRFVPRKFRLLLYLFLIIVTAVTLLLFYDINVKSRLPNDANRENDVFRNIDRELEKYIPQDNRDEIRNSSEINIMIIFTNADGNYNLKRNFERLCTSLLMHSSAALAMHIVGDAPSRKIASDIITKVSSSAKVPIRVSSADLLQIIRFEGSNFSGYIFRSVFKIYLDQDIQFLKIIFCSRIPEIEQMLCYEI